MYSKTFSMSSFTQFLVLPNFNVKLNDNIKIIFVHVNLNKVYVIEVYICLQIQKRNT